MPGWVCASLVNNVGNKRERFHIFGLAKGAGYETIERSGLLRSSISSNSPVSFEWKASRAMWRALYYD